MSWLFWRKPELPKGMVDLHNHVVFGLDDGAQNPSESLAMMKMFDEAGFATVVATPHFGHPLFPGVDERQIRTGVKALNMMAQEHGLEVSFEPGSEIYYNEDLLDLLEEGKLVPLGKVGKYMLVEFPPLDPMPHLKDVGFALGVKGFRPVLAHPERYQILLERPSLAREWVESGWILQLDLPSLMDSDGKIVRKMAHHLLHEKLYGIAATDLHQFGPDTVVKDMVQALARLVDREELERLMVHNPQRIIEGKNLIELWDDD